MFPFHPRIWYVARASRDFVAHPRARCHPFSRRRCWTQPIGAAPPRRGAPARVRTAASEGDASSHDFDATEATSSGSSQAAAVEVASATLAASRANATSRGATHAAARRVRGAPAAACASARRRPRFARARLVLFAQLHALRADADLRRLCPFPKRRARPDGRAFLLWAEDTNLRPPPGGRDVAEDARRGTAREDVAREDRTRGRRRRDIYRPHAESADGPHERARRGRPVRALPLLVRQIHARSSPAPLPPFRQGQLFGARARVRQTARTADGSDPDGAGPRLSVTTLSAAPRERARTGEMWRLVGEAKLPAPRRARPIARRARGPHGRPRSFRRACRCASRLARRSPSSPSRTTARCWTVWKRRSTPTRRLVRIDVPVPRGGRAGSRASRRRMRRRPSTRSAPSAPRAPR